MRLKQITLRHWIEYYLLGGVLFAVKVSPLVLSGLYRRMFALLAKISLRRHARLVLGNLAIAFPDMTRPERLELRERIFDHFSTVFIQMIFLYTRKAPEKVFPIKEVRNLDHLRQARERGRGVIVLSAHFGNWEMIPFMLSRELGAPIYSIARMMDNPLIERVVSRFRRYMGSHIIYKIGSIRKTLALLKDNQVFLFLIDQNTLPREAVFVEFFGRSASTIASVAQLQLRRGIAVVPLFVHYVTGKIVLDVLPELDFRRSGDQNGDVARLTQAYTNLIEQQIRKFPEQWFWFHNRWKSHPAGGNHET